MKNLELFGSNGGENLEVIDMRTDQTVEDRNQTREFIINTETAYKFYRWSMAELITGTVFQVGEWRLFDDN